jgi:hypothetical protein
VDTESFYLVPIRLPEQVPAEDFETFMLEDVFPAIPKGAGRAGQITSLRLFGGNNSGPSGNLNDYLWLISGAVNGIPATQQLDRIRSFGAEAPAEGVQGGDYREVGRWDAEGQ